MMGPSQDEMHRIDALLKETGTQFTKQLPMHWGFVLLFAQAVQPGEDAVVIGLSNIEETEIQALVVDWLESHQLLPYPVEH